MSDKREKLSILQTLTVSNLKEICEKNNLKGYSGTKKELAKFMVDNLEISLEELKDICNIYRIDKLLGKIRDCRDHFLNKRVTIRCKDKISPIVDVGGHRVIINNLGKEDFSYMCDDKCADYLYQVKRGSMQIQVANATVFRRPHAELKTLKFSAAGRLTYLVLF